MEDPENPSPETEERWRKDPNNWIWGFFYYNKEDGRLLPPKKKPHDGFHHQFCQSRIRCCFFVIMMLFFLADCICHHGQKISYSTVINRNCSTSPLKILTSTLPFIPATDAFR